MWKGRKFGFNKHKHRSNLDRTPYHSVICFGLDNSDLQNLQKIEVDFAKNNFKKQ